MSLRRGFVSAIGTIVVCAAATAAAAAPVIAGTTPSDGLGAIDVIIQTPPAVATDLDFRLLLDGTDVRADRCRSATISYVEDAQVFRCDALADGAYTLELGPLPDGWYSSPWDCAEPIGFSTFAPQPTIGLGTGESMHWGCSVAATPPVISGEYQPFDTIPAEPGAIAYTFLDESGAEVPAACEPSLDFEGPTPCHFVEPGTHTMRLDGIPEDYRVRTSCAPMWLWTPTGEPPIEREDAAVTPELPWWTCAAFAWAPIMVEAGDSALITLTGADGVVEGACRTVYPGMWHCLGIPDGVYRLDASVDGESRQVTCSVVDESEPAAPLFTDDPSGDVTVAGLEPEQCRVGSSPPAPTSAPVPTSPPQLPDTGGQLPVTGAPGPLVGALAALLLTAGLACLALAARRRPA